MAPERTVNVLIASVGGQGGLTLSRVLAEAAVAAGLSARTGETLGMAQRFGSVLSFVRIGRAVLSPTFSPGEADYVVALELYEALRARHYLSPGGLALIADALKPPVSASLSPAGRAGRERVLEMVRASYGSRGVLVPALELAARAGSPRAMNMVMLGALNAAARLLPHDAVEAAILSVLPGRRGEVSLAAYRLGLEYASGAEGLPQYSRL